MERSLSRRGFLGVLLGAGVAALVPATAEAHSRAHHRPPPHRQAPWGWARPQPRRRAVPRRPYYHDPRRRFAPAPRPGHGPYCLRRTRRGDWVLVPCR